MIVSDVLPASWRDVFDSNHKRIGIGVDPATTTKKKSNPSAVAVIQQVGLSFFVRVLLRFKTSDPAVTTAVLRELAAELPHGLRVRRLAILATNERFFAAQLRKDFAGIVPVEQLIESEATTYLGEKMLVKSYLGNQLINTIDDGYLPLPDEKWVLNDFRQTTRDKGSFTCDPDETGNHADGFCAVGAALHAVMGKGGPAMAAAAAVGQYSGNATGRQFKNPFAHLHLSGKGARLHA